MNAPIIWLSNKQNTVDCRMFGSEFVVMRIPRDLIVALHYKLGMFGVQLDGPHNVMCDYQVVVNNMVLPQSTMGKKHNAVNYHAVHEASAVGILRVVKEDTETNLSYILKNILGGNDVII